MSGPRARRIRVCRKLTGVVHHAREFREGEDFFTIISRKPGVVLEVRRDGVLAAVEGEDKPRRIHPNVLLEHA